MHQDWLTFEAQDCTYFSDELFADLLSPFRMVRVPPIPVQGVFLDGYLASALPLFGGELRRCCELHVRATRLGLALIKLVSEVAQPHADHVKI